MLDKYISEEYQKYLCKCVLPYILDNFIEGKHKICGELKLSDNLVHDYFMGIRYPMHKDSLGIRICCDNQPERSKREDIEHCTPDSDCRRYGCQ